ncbi:MAG: DUF5058 family protein [Oscillospiraceae bacterium]
MFNPNDGFMYAITAVVVVVIIAQSVFFLVKALAQARKIGMKESVLKNTMITAAVFTIAPSVAILLGVIALSKALGFPFPWLRLSVIGALTYETTAAASAASAIGLSLSNLIDDPRAFSTIAWVMTLGILPGPILVSVFGKRIENGLTKLGAKDKRWSEFFMTGLFLGMISAFLGVIFADVTQGITGWIPVFVMLVSAVIMLICGAIHKKTGARWITEYALPISMLGAMALSIPLTDFITKLANGGV